MIASVTIVVICQVLPLVFAIVVKGWRVKLMRVLFAVNNEKISEAITKKISVYVQRNNFREKCVFFQRDNKRVTKG